MSTRRPPTRLLVPAALVGTLGIGLWLRWALTGLQDPVLPVAQLRHAHSHLGYYGLLFPLAWLGQRAGGASGREAPPRGRWLALYGAATLLSTAGFLRSGYGPLAIAGSTVVASFWLWSGARLWRRMGALNDPLGAVPLGTVAALACLPPIALNLRTRPEFARGLVSTFLAALLLLVIVPSALAARRQRLGPWPALLLGGALGALYLGPLPHPVTGAGLVLYAAVLANIVSSREVPVHLRAVWDALAFGLAMMGARLLPNTRSVALGALHFLILGPILSTLTPHWLRRTPPSAVWWLGHALWGAMSAGLVLWELAPRAWTPQLIAWSGTGIVLWWALVLVWSGLGSPQPEKGVDEAGGGD